MDRRGLVHGHGDAGRVRRWGVAACCEVAPRRAEPLELVTRVRSEAHALARAHELAAAALEGQRTETIAIAARVTGR